MSSYRRSRKKTRWARDKIELDGMPCCLPSGLTDDQERLYILQFKIEVLTSRIKNNDIYLPDINEDRSPSPEPIYNADGKRLNTREYRAKRKLEDERHLLILKMLEENPFYFPPPDYRPPVLKITEKVLIPCDDFPKINFMGLLLGPRGSTLKNMEKDSGAKIVIRGKGSVKEGKANRKDGQTMMGEDEPMHAIVTGINQEQVDIAVGKIREIVRQGIEVPEEQNDLKRNQLRELAMHNGTLRESATLKTWAHTTNNITNSIICTSCGGAGHLSRDCRIRNPTYFRNQSNSEYLTGANYDHLDIQSQTDQQPTEPEPDDDYPKTNEKVDEAYEYLMSELGETNTQKADDK